MQRRHLAELRRRRANHAMLGCGGIADRRALSFNIPGPGLLRLDYLVLDVNGTLTDRFRLAPNQHAVATARL